MATIFLTYLSYEENKPLQTIKAGGTKPEKSVCIRDLAIAGLGESASRSHDNFSTIKRGGSSHPQTNSTSFGDSQIIAMMANLERHRGAITAFWDRPTDSIRFALAGTTPKGPTEFEYPRITNIHASQSEIKKTLDDFYADCIKACNALKISAGGGKLSGFNVQATIHAGYPSGGALVVKPAGHSGASV